MGLGSVPALPPMDHRTRLQRLRAELAAHHGPASVMLAHPTSIRWCTGFTGSTALVLVGVDDITLVTDRRYDDRARAELDTAGLADEVDVVVHATQAERRSMVIERLSGRGAVGAEAQHLSHAQWTDLAAELDLCAVDDVMRVVRRIKDDGEIARIERACAIADHALAQIAPVLGDHPTELDVRTELEYTMRRLGADGPSYDTIVASGPSHAARPHHGAERRRLEAGDTVVIDVGALVDGYHSDMTRTFVLGDPTPDQQRIYDVVLDAQRAGLAAVAAGVPAREVDRASRAVAIDHGYHDWYLHSTGHGVGLDIHEEPFETPWSEATLMAGDVVTVEPGLYRAGFGGVRIEDLVVVTDAGHRLLTHSPKDTPCLPSRPTT